MDCPNCGAYTQGTFCPQCGMPVQQHASAPQQYASATQTAQQPATNKTQPWIYAAVIAALVALGAGSFFLISELSGKKKDDALPPSVNTSSSATVSQSAPASPTQTTTPTQTAPVATPTTDGSTPTTSSTDEINAAVTKEFNDRANEDMQHVTISEDSYAARVSSKWIGITDPTLHPQPFTAEEIRDHFHGLEQTYGDKLRILRIKSVGQQEATYGDGWIAVVLDPSITSVQSARDWCKSDAYKGIPGDCAEQHLDKAHW